MTLEELYKTRGVLARRIRPYVTSECVSEDIIQEAFLKAFSCIDSYNPKKASLKTWFSKILFSCVWDYKRKQKRQVITTDLEEGENCQMALESSLEEFFEEIRNNSHRKILWLLHEGGYNYKEVAHLCETTEANVRKINQRFRDKSGVVG